ncbi:MAG: hypothetical protein EA357_11680 [Micavibrio sp.]|nr:MAG: hypothetical protein EA357_11680 [Micavibrio sp.]
MTENKTDVTGTAPQNETKTDTQTNAPKSRFWRGVRSVSEKIGTGVKLAALGTLVAGAIVGLALAAPVAMLVAVRLAIPLLLLGTIGYGVYSIAKTLSGGGDAKKKAAKKPEIRISKVEDAPTRGMKPGMGNAPDFNNRAENTGSRDPVNDDTQTPRQSSVKPGSLRK